MTVTDAPQVLENPCETHSATLKEIFSHILGADDAPLAARLFAAAAFAFEADAFMYADSRDFSEDRLALEINRAADRVYERIWIDQLQDQQQELEVPMSMVQSFLLGRLDHFDPGFRETIASAWSACAPEAADVRDGAFLQVQRSKGHARVLCSDLAAEYQQRRDILYKIAGRQVEDNLTDFATGFMAARNPENYRSLSSLVQDLVLHTMMLKFFLACDTHLVELSHDPEKADELIKDIISRTQAALADQKPAMEDLEEMVFDQGLQELAHTVLLISF